MIGINMQLQFFASVHKTLSLRASPQTGAAIRFPLCSLLQEKRSEICSAWDMDFRVGAKHLRCTLFAQTQAPAQPLRPLETATGGTPLRLASLRSSQ